MSSCEKPAVSLTREELGSNGGVVIVDVRGREPVILSGNKKL